MKRLVRWTATYETVIDVPEGDDEKDYAASIEIDVKGSIYQSDTWEVERIGEPSEDDIACHEALQS